MGSDESSDFRPRAFWIAVAFMAVSCLLDGILRHHKCAPSVKSVTECPNLYAAFEMCNFGPIFCHLCIYPREGNSVYWKTYPNVYKMVDKGKEMLTMNVV